MTHKVPLSVVPRARILVVDDNPAIREVVVRGLEGLGFLVEEAADGRRALDMLAASSYDILIADIVMPHVDGVALAARAREVYPFLRIIVLSGYARERDRAQNSIALADKVLAKPFSLEELSLVVENVLKLCS
ncbi:MAG: response regulator [Alphaproteobacteria bacterium]|nr:response regulator [Alphaproteobacteria bacterium]